MKNITKSCITVLFLSLLFVPKSYAVPAFGKAAGNVSCAACHATPTWQLNKTGLDFLRNGHRGEAKEFAVEDIKWDNYLSLVWKGRAKYVENATARVQLEQHSFSLYSGGPLSDRFSYFTEMYFSENTGATAASSTATANNIAQGDAARKKLAEAFLQYNQPITDKSFIAFRFGEILPEIIHTFGVGARSIEDRAQIFNVGVRSANPWKPFTRSQGLDAKFNSEHFEATVGVVNGANVNTNAIDDNNHKDLYGALQYEFDTNGSALGVFHYIGEARETATFNNEFNRTLVLGRFVMPDNKGRVSAAYMMGEEHSSATTTVKNNGYYGLVDYNFAPKYGVAVRYDNLNPTDSGRGEIKLITVGANGFLFENKLSAARWSIDLSEKKTSSTSTAVASKVKQIYGQLTWAL